MKKELEGCGYVCVVLVLDEALNSILKQHKPRAKIRLDYEYHLLKVVEWVYHCPLQGIGLYKLNGLARSTEGGADI